MMDSDPEIPDHPDRVDSDVDEHPGSGGEVVGRFPSYDSSGDCVLLILSMGIPCWIFLRDGYYEVMVERAHVQAVRKQMEVSSRENAHWPPRPIKPGPQMWRSVPLGYPLVVCAVMGLLYALQHHYFGSGILARVAGLDASAVVDHHQWWRPLTALMLHGDLSHLLGNLGMGFVFAWFLSRSWHVSVIFASVSLSAWLGNSINAFFQYPDPRLSYGASTAVFALVGLIVGNAMTEGVPPAGKHPILRLFFPLLTGIIILGWWGTAGANTDVSAHVFGLASGIPIGVLGASVNRLSGHRLRLLLGFLSAIAFIASWFMVFLVTGFFA